MKNRNSSTHGKNGLVGRSVQKIVFLTPKQDEAVKRLVPVAFGQYVRNLIRADFEKEGDVWPDDEPVNLPGTMPTEKSFDLNPYVKPAMRRLLTPPKHQQRRKQ